MPKESINFAKKKNSLKSLKLIALRSADLQRKPIIFLGILLVGGVCVMEE